MDDAHEKTVVDIDEKRIDNSENLQKAKKRSNLRNPSTIFIPFILAIVLISVLAYLRTTEVIDWDIGPILSPIMIVNIAALRQELKQLKSQEQRHDSQKFQNLQSRNDTKGKILQLYVKYNRIGVLCLITLVQVQVIFDFDASHSWASNAFFAPFFVSLLEQILTVDKIDWIITLPLSIQMLLYIYNNVHRDIPLKYLFIPTYFNVGVGLFRYIKKKRAVVAI